MDSSSSKPLVSVVMAVYNGEPYLGAAIESIQNQTFRDLEFIIVNDGSTDGTGDILSGYQAGDSRIQILRHSENKGIVASLNWGCQTARGKYIARMDADDVSMPTRIEKLVGYIEKHPEVGMVSGQTRFIDKNGRRDSGAPRHPLTSGLIKWNLNFYCCFDHAPALMRREVLEQLEFYNPQFRWGEDYDLFLRASQITRLVNLSDVLYEIRMWQQSSTRVHKPEMRVLVFQLVKDHIERQVGFAPPDEAVLGVQGLINEHYPETLDGLQATAKLVVQLWQSFSNDGVLGKADLRQVRLNVGVRLWQLAGLIARHDARGALDVAWQAIRIQPASFVAALFKLARRFVLRVVEPWAKMEPSVPGGAASNGGD